MDRELKEIFPVCFSLSMHKDEKIADFGRDWLNASDA